MSVPSRQLARFSLDSPALKLTMKSKPKRASSAPCIGEGAKMFQSAHTRTALTPLLRLAASALDDSNRAEWRLRLRAKHGATTVQPDVGPLPD